MRQTAGHTWTDRKTNTQTANGLDINPGFVQNTGLQKEIGLNK